MLWSVIPPLTGNPDNRYKNLYYKFDDYLLYVQKLWEIKNPTPQHCILHSFKLTKPSQT